jgi:predicted esterase
VHIVSDEAGRVSLDCLEPGDQAEIYIRVPHGKWNLYPVEVPREGDRIDVSTQPEEARDREASIARDSAFRLVSVEQADDQRAIWARKLAALKQGGNWRTAFGVGLELADLAPDEGFAILRDNWLRIEAPEARQQILKAWVNTMPYPLQARNHPRLLDVLNLGMHDPSPEVRKWALNYVREVALADFAADFSAYEAWYAANREKPVGQVVGDSVRTLVARAAERHDPAALAALASDVRYTFRDTVEAREAALEAGLPKLIEQWVTDARGPRASRGQIDLAAAGLEILRYLDPGEEALRRIVVSALDQQVPPRVRSAAVGSLARDDCRWAVDLLVDVLKEAAGQADRRAVLWSTAGALAEIGDPKAIPPMIAVIEADNTYDTVYGVGHFGLGKLTGVKYDDKHDGAWWRAWWEENKSRYQEAEPEAPQPQRVMANRISQPPPDDDVADVPAEDLRAGGDEKKRYFLIGTADKEQTPENGYKLLIVLPGGDGGADFNPFVRRIYQNVLDKDWLIAQVVAPEWDGKQFEKLVWPTIKDRYPAAKFTTEALVAAVLKDVQAKVKVNPRRIFMLGWSSGGPPVYATTLVKNSPIVGAFVAMSIFVPSQMPALEGGKHKAFYLLQSPDDQLTRIRFAETAEKSLSAAGANVKLERYPGGHGWRGDVCGMLAAGIQWLEAHTPGEK